MKKAFKPYYVLTWDFNKKDIEFYDIMPYLINELKEEKKRKHKIFCKKLESTDDYKEFILKASMYRFWSKCEYEILVDSFPPNNKPKKIDVYDQIRANIDVITNHFINQL